MKIGLCIAVLSPAILANDTVVHAGRLIDVSTRQIKSKASIVIHDDRIVRVEDGYVSPPGAAVIDLTNFTVLPGLIDCHKHISLRPGSRARKGTETILTPS